MGALQGPELVNRAMDGDEVVVEMLAADKWAAASSALIRDNVDETESGLINDSEPVEASMSRVRASE